LIHEAAASDQRVVVDQPQTALDSRVLIEQAKGILAERRGITPNEAFDVLRRQARNTGQKLTALAAAVINGPAPDPTYSDTTS